MAGDTVQQIKDRLSIVDVVSQYVKLERSGRNLRARCPFHTERTPSFFVSPERGTYHCFGCNIGGDIFSFVQQVEGLDFKGALKVLAERAGVEVTYRHGNEGEKNERERLFELLETAAVFYESQLNDTARRYLKERGISDSTMRAFRLGLASGAWREVSEYLTSRKFTDREIVDAGLAKRGNRGLIDRFRNRIMFPINDSAGRVVGFSGRIFGENVSPEAPKYLNSPESLLFRKSSILYGLDRAKTSIRRLNCAVLVEGQMDLLASHQAGWGNTVAVSGTAFTPDHARLIKRITDNLVIALDADEAGVRAAGRAARAALTAGLNVKVARLIEGYDPADLILKEGREAWSRAIREAKDVITFLLDVLEERAKNADSLRRNVELIVLPFIADVQSPIAREQHVREVAFRLRVSETAIMRSLADIAQSSDALNIRGDAALQTPERRQPDRASQAYALLLWQQSQPKPNIDTELYERELTEAIGREKKQELDKISESEKEQLRFVAEAMYGASNSIEREARQLLRSLLKDRLTHELFEITTALRAAEVEGDEKKLSTLISVHNVLTKRIAELT